MTRQALPGVYNRTAWRWCMANPVEKAATVADRLECIKQATALVVACASRKTEPLKREDLVKDVVNVAAELEKYLMIKGALTESVKALYHW